MSFSRCALGAQKKVLSDGRGGVFIRVLGLLADRTQEDFTVTHCRVDAGVLVARTRRIEGGLGYGSDTLPVLACKRVYLRTNHAGHSPGA